MVAETFPAQTKSKRGKFRPTFPLPLKLKVRSLYIIQQLSSAEIGAQVGLTRKQVQDLVKREGWISVKRRAKASFIAKHDAQACEQVAEIHESFAVKTEELSMAVLGKLDKRMPDEDENVARDLQAFSATAKNLIGVARQIRGMDSGKRDMPGGNTIIFLGSAPRVGDSVKRSEVNVTPAAIEIQAAKADASMHPQSQILPSSE